jgi:hypothetical protein
MSKYIFIKQAEDDNWLEEGDGKITVEFNANDLDRIVEEFTYFLRGAGFFIDGHLDIVQDDPNIIHINDSQEDLDNLDQWFETAQTVAKAIDSGDYVPPNSEQILE